MLSAWRRRPAPRPTPCTPPGFEGAGFRIAYSFSLAYTLAVVWRVEVTDEFANWARALRKLDRESSRQVGAAVELLKQHGPSLKRPLVGEITASKIKNLKELRPGSTGRSEIRILFVFDPWQQIVLLLAGDKAGDWRGWYRKAIPRAEQLYAEHVEAMSSDGEGAR
jgi:hypothetical protein